MAYAASVTPQTVLSLVIIPAPGALRCYVGFMVAAVRGVLRGPDLDVQVIVRSLRCVAGTIFRRSVKMDGLHYVVSAQPLVCAPDSHYVVEAESPCGVHRQAWYPGSCVASPRTEPAGD